ncbi:MAG: hypothetical protein B1H04_04820 [Planctomycetales bacterium 4484_123]|nr:MAG: hypothetical protein B1H04_04820 [Planctomycetales bacterium 4484_123]
MGDMGEMGHLAAYFSTFKILLIMVALVPWLYSVAWMNRDAKRVRTVGPFWCGIALGAGVVGVAALLLVPYFIAGMAIYLVLAGGAIGAYVFDRNRRVVPEARVLTVDHLRAVWTREQREQVEVVEHVQLYDADGRAVRPPPEEEVERRKAYAAAQELLHDVVTFRASEVRLVPAGPQTLVRFVVDGVVQERPAMDRQKADLLIDFLKAAAGMNVEDRRRPQEGSVSLDMGPVRADMQVASAGDTRGQRLRLRVLQEAVQTVLEDLGMPDGVQSRIIEINASGSGLIIVSGPRGNGVTSTLYSLLRKHDAFMKELVTLEASPVMDLENVTQHAYGEPEALAEHLGRALRRDPDVVMVDTCQTPEAAELICQAAASKTILLGYTASSSFVALAKWLKACGGGTAASRERAVANLRAVLCQRLLRKLCPQCREAYRPSSEMLAKLNLPAEKIGQFYRPPKQLTDEKGRPITCATCRGTGYMGRTAAFELLELNDEIRRLIVDAAPLDQIKAACRRNGMLYLQEQALRKVIEGVTSIAEVIRVTKGK